MFRLLFAAILITYSALLPPARAQSAAPPHPHGSVPTVDGAAHPELIPDSLAYRLYFVAVSTAPNPSEEDRKRQRAHLNKIGLEDLDREILVGVLAEFRAKHDAVAARYDEAARVALARNQPPDVASFLQQLDELVQLTRGTLKLRLTQEAMTQFDAFVQSEKKHMRMHGGSQ